MVRHEAVSPDLDSMAVAPFRQQSHVEEVIVRTEERPLSTVTALRDVVWQGGDDGAGHASHGDRVPTIPRMQLGRVTYRSGESATHASWHGVAYGVPRSPPDLRIPPDICLEEAEHAQEAWCRCEASGGEPALVTDDTTYSSGQARYAGVRCQYNNSCGSGSYWFEAHPTSSKFWDAAGGGECP
jgi:hypothetical protein